MFQRYKQTTLPITLAIILGYSTPGLASGHPLPNLELVGVVKAGSEFDQALVQVDGQNRVLYWLDAIDEDWWLEQIGKDHILLTDGERFARVELYHGRPTLVSNESVDNSYLPGDETQHLPAVSLPGVESSRLEVVPLPGPKFTLTGTVHTAATHADLQPGQQRSFHALAEEPDDEITEESPMAQWEAIQNELNDLGMSRRFTSEPAPVADETTESEDDLDVAQLGSGTEITLEPGQSRRFGPPASLDEEDTEE